MQKNSDAIFCKVAFGFRIYRENMNITDLPEGPYTIACYNRRNRIVLNGSCAHASAAAVQARVTAEIDKIEVQISKSGILSALNIYGGHPRQRMKTISVIDVLLLIVVAPWIAIMAVPVLPVITLLSVINLCRHLSVRAVWQHVDQPAKREAHAVGLILPVPAHPVRRDLPSALRQFAFHVSRAARLDEQALAITAAI